MRRLLPLHLCGMLAGVRWEAAPLRLRSDRLSTSLGMAEFFGSRGITEGFADVLESSVGRVSVRFPG